MSKSFAVLACALALAACVPSRPSPFPVSRANLAVYRFDTGDRLRVTVRNDQGLSSVYLVNSSGNIAMPLVGDVPARGLSSEELEAEIMALLRAKKVRDPSVAVQVDTHRPVFILGEVNASGQTPYVNGMTVQMAVATAGGFSPRAARSHVIVTRRVDGVFVRRRLSVYDPVLPGDTIQVSERIF